MSEKCLGARRAPAVGALCFVWIAVNMAIPAVFMEQMITCNTVYKIISLEVFKAYSALGVGTHEPVHNNWRLILAFSPTLALSWSGHFTTFLRPLHVDLLQLVNCTDFIQKRAVRTNISSGNTWRIGRLSFGRRWPIRSVWHFTRVTCACW